MRRKSPLEKLEEMEERLQAWAEFKKALSEGYIETPPGKLTIWILNKLEKFLNRRKG